MPELPSVSESAGGESVMPISSGVHAAPPRADEGERYLDLDLVGRGGMGEVRRVWDRRLGRAVVRKTVRPDRRDAVLDRRFLAEAKLGAQLEHPGTVPVYDLGWQPDGSAWFTMKEVRGRTLASLIADLHRELDRGREVSWPPRRLVDALVRVAEAVAYANSRGVLHRDIKPSNIMVGDFGEIVVLDWGAARLMSDLQEPATSEPEEGEPLHTRAGAVIGTLQYMPPEQARGQLHLLDARSDVFALGAVLYEILTGRAPFAGESFQEVYAAALNARCRDVADACPRRVPDELLAICRKAMARDRADRYADAGLLADALQAWQDGDLRRAKAREIVAGTRARTAQVAELRAWAASLREEAARLGRDLKTWDSIEKKGPVWAQEDEARRLLRDAALEEVEIAQGLGSALSWDPDLDEAHALLADLYRAQHALAEARGDADHALRCEALVRAHDRGMHRAWLEGTGSLTLQSDPPGAEALLYRLEARGRRLEPVLDRSLGQTPLTGVPLAPGSWLVELRAPGHAAVRYPVSLGRCEDWSGVRPGDAAPTPIRLPPLGELGPDDVYVPAGLAWLGSDHARNAVPRRRLWIDGFVIRRHPVTNREYMAFLDDLVRQGREEEALRHQPRREGTRPDEPGAPLYGRDAAGRFALVPDAEGDLWDPDWPVCLVDWEGARAYAAWEAARTGLPWRLPGELEREKAGRGADGRAYPWGDFPEPTWSCNGQARAGRPLLASVQDFSTDISIYGVRGLAGNIRDWCQDLRLPAGPELLPGGLPAPPSTEEGGPDTWRVTRGGAWSAGVAYGELAQRLGGPQQLRNALIGFRLARDASAR